jgi:serine/threonine protein kinase
MKAEALEGYQQLEKLGAGAFGTVWDVVDSAGVSFAAKQMLRQTGQAAAEREVRAFEVLFPSTFYAQRYLCRLVHTVSTPKHLWLVFEKGGVSLSDLSFKVKGEFFKGERVYRVHHLPFFEHLRSSPAAVQRLVSELLQVVEYISSLGIVHSDLKPDNILIRQDHSGAYAGLQLCDFGSSCIVQEQSTFVPSPSATPEYAAPEVNRLHAQSAQLNRGQPPQNVKCLPQALDIWSIGATLLELACGSPVYMPYKLRVVDHRGKNFLRPGMFSSSGRESSKVAAKQKEVVSMSKFRHIVANSPGVGLESDGLDLLQRLLCLDASKRIAASEALQHPFLCVESDRLIA